MSFFRRRSSVLAILAGATVLISTPASAATEVLKVGQTLPRFALLTPGARVYLRYTIGPDGKRTAKDIWRRGVRFETRGGKRVFEIAQRWDGVGAQPYVSRQTSWFEAGTFRPLTHERDVTRDGKTETHSFTFSPDRIVRDDGVAVASPEPAYNFETDMEFLQVLPLAKDYAADINFYDPDREPPHRYTFKVVGEDTISTADGRKVAAWVVSCDYNRPAGPVARFWFAKSTQVMLREEAKLPDGSVLVKTLLTEEAPEAAPRT